MCNFVIQNTAEISDTSISLYSASAFRNSDFFDFVEGILEV